MSTHDLQRFIDAQAENYRNALRELEAGRKRSHWIWYIFPQVAGLGHSPVAQFYAIGSKGEAIAYLRHRVLGERLQQCCKALLRHAGKDVHDIMGYPDDLKLCSSMTLFALVAEPDSIFHAVLNSFYGGSMDHRTVTFLSS